MMEHRFGRCCFLGVLRLRPLMILASSVGLWVVLELKPSFMALNKLAVSHEYRYKRHSEEIYLYMDE